MSVRYLTVKEATAELRVSERVVLHLIDTGRLEAVNVSAGSSRPRWRIPSLALERMATQRLEQDARRRMGQLA